jgi:hypothetical protein
MDILLAGTLILPWRIDCAGYDVQRRRALENIPGIAKAIPGSGEKLFAFPPESLFAFSPESCSSSSRNPVRLAPEFATRLSQYEYGRVK